MNPSVPRIGLVRRGYSGTGGAERYLGRFADALAAAGHRPVLFGSPEWPRAEWPHDFVEVPGNGPVRFADALAAANPKAACDFVFSLERIWSCDAYRAGDGVHRAWLERRQAFEPRWKGWVRGIRAKHRELLRLERSAFDPASTGAVIANARFVADEITRIYGYPVDRIHVVPNGLPAHASAIPALERAEARARLGLPERAILGLFLGSGWERKGLPCALRAAEQLGERFRLVVAGRGRAAAHSSPAAILLGPVADPGPVLAACDLFVLPTWYDPFSNACLEAAAAGLPVITTRANGFSEVMEPGLHGAIVNDPGDADGLAVALRAWCDRDRIEGARDSMRALAGRFTIEANLRATLAALGLAAPQDSGPTSSAKN
jgi:UDP-glucose:(heptosyl)LPS alpha-1,3-glucosyltransferase